MMSLRLYLPLLHLLEQYTCYHKTEEGMQTFTPSDPAPSDSLIHVYISGVSILCILSRIEHRP